MLQSCSVKFELRKLCVVLQNSRWNFVYVVMLMRNSKKPPSFVLVAAELSWPEWGRSPRRKFRLGRPDRRPRRRRHSTSAPTHRSSPAVTNTIHPLHLHCKLLWTNFYQEASIFNYYEQTWYGYIWGVFRSFYIFVFLEGNLQYLKY